MLPALWNQDEGVEPFDCSESRLHLPLSTGRHTLRKLDWPLFCTWHLRGCSWPVGIDFFPDFALRTALSLCSVYVLFMFKPTWDASDESNHFSHCPLTVTAARETDTNRCKAIWICKAHAVSTLCKAAKSQDITPELLSQAVAQITEVWKLWKLWKPS